MLILQTKSQNDIPLASNNSIKCIIFDQPHTWIISGCILLKIGFEFLETYHLPQAARKKQMIQKYFYGTPWWLGTLNQATQIRLVWNQWSFHRPWHLRLRFGPHGHRGFLVGISFQHWLCDMEDDLQLAQLSMVK